MLANKKTPPNIYFNVRQPSSFPDNRGVSLAATPNRFGTRVLGLALKENSPNLRNDRMLDIVHALIDCNTHLEGLNPRMDAEEARNNDRVAMLAPTEAGDRDAVVLAVGHDIFRAQTGLVSAEPTRARPSWCATSSACCSVM